MKFILLYLFFFLGTLMSNNRIEDEQKIRNQVFINKDRPQMMNEGFNILHELVGAIMCQTHETLGTGILIANDLFLTCAHNLCRKEYKCKDLKVYIGLRGTLTQQHIFQVESYFFPHQFLQEDTTAKDWALLKLSRKADVHEFIHLRPDITKINEKQDVTILGYSGREGNKFETTRTLNQWGLTKDSNSISNIDHELSEIVHFISTFSGQSGSPIILRDETDKIVMIGLHKGGIDCEDKGNNYNKGVLLNEFMIQNMKQEAKKMNTLLFEGLQSAHIDLQKRYDNVKNKIYFENGKKLMKQKNWSETVQCYQKILKSQPKNIEALCQKTFALLESERFEEALKTSLYAIKVDKNCAQAYAFLSWALWKDGNFDESMLNANRALEIDPLNLNALNLKGINHCQRRQYEKSIQCHQKAIKINPKFPKSFNNLGFTFKLLGNKKEALHNYQIAVSLDSTCAYFIYNVGTIYEDSGKYQQAFKHYENARNSSPPLAKANYKKGVILQILKEKEEAKIWFHKAININKKFIPAYIKIAENFLQEGNIYQAIYFYDQALYYNDKDAQLSYKLGYLFQQLDLKQNKSQYRTEAKNHYRKALELNPTQQKYYNSFLLILLETQTIEEHYFINKMLERSYIIQKSYQRIIQQKIRRPLEKK